MQPVTVFILLLSCVMVVIIALIIKDDRKVKRERKKNQALKFYDADYVIIADKIERSKNLYQLQNMLQDIHWFKHEYKLHQCSVTLQMDTNRLIRQWREKKITYEIRIAVFDTYN